MLIYTQGVLVYKWFSGKTVRSFFLLMFLFFLSSPGLWITTECGKLQVSPGEIVVIPQGFRFAVDLPDGPSRGYVTEIFGIHFQLPDLGPIGMSS